MKIIRLILKVIVSILSIALLVALIPYCFSGMYDFPPPQPFSGEYLYNPYNSIPRLIKANFHAHATAYKGVTDGHTTESEMYDVYKSMNYDVVGISNYQTIDSTFKADSGYIPLYEHGYNLWKRHHIALGANEISWWDYILFQSIHQKQDILHRLLPTTDALAIAHPKFRDSFDPDDFTQLTDYTCIEVLNHYRTSDEAWDSALSAGRAAWILADDDSHNSKSDGETGVCWTMIASASPDHDSIISSIKAGRMYGVSGIRGKNLNLLNHVKTQGLSCYFTFEMPADSIHIIGQHGKLLQRLFGSNKAVYTFSEHDTYIRAKVYTREHTMWLNPIFRVSNSGIVHQHSSQNFLFTWLWRLGWCGGLIIFTLLISKFIFKKKR
ncbi:MAG: hypothetical protein IPM69_08025 [Ignavibacteria bacterium]|nr:hypothetical protein [Ignavibacteria bacterium]